MVFVAWEQSKVYVRVRTVPNHTCFLTVAVPGVMRPFPLRHVVWGVHAFLSVVSLNVGVAHCVHCVSAVEVPSAVLPHPGPHSE